MSADHLPLHAMHLLHTIHSFYSVFHLTCRVLVMKSRPRDVGKSYTGHIPELDDKTHVLETPFHRPENLTKGYSGHQPMFNNRGMTRMETCPSSSSPMLTPNDVGFDFDSEDDKNPGKFRKLGQHMDTLERYETARQELFKRGQSQQMLMRIVQAKLSERVTSYAQQHIWLRNLFSNFDDDGSMSLDEAEFRQCLELMNIQLDDCQFLALFAYFDKDQNGTIDFEEFSHYAMIPNPKGGTAILTKSITSNMSSETWYPLKLSHHEP